MRTILTELARFARTSGALNAGLRLAVLAAFAIAVLVAAFTAFFVLLPLAVLAGLALRFYLKRKIRRPAPAADVIEVEYTVIER